MKKQYIIAFLLLTGLGVVTTMAWSIGNTSLAATVQANYAVTADMDTTIDSIKIKPYASTGDPEDGIYLKLTLSDTAATNDATRLMLNVTTSGANIDFSGSAVTYQVGGSGGFVSTNVVLETDGFGITGLSLDGVTKLEIRAYEAASDMYTSGVGLNLTLE